LPGPDSGDGAKPKKKPPANDGGTDKKPTPKGKKRR
jgi:hypothetical protein